MDSQKFGAGHAGGVDTFLWDRTVSENNDYKRVGIIDNGVCELTPDYYYDDAAREFAKSMGAVEFVNIFVNMSEDEIIEFAKNPNTSTEVLKRLSNDENRYISESASTNLLSQSPNVDKDEWEKFAKTVPKYEHKLKGLHMPKNTLI